MGWRAAARRLFRSSHRRFSCTPQAPPNNLSHRAWALSAQQVPADAYAALALLQCHVLDEDRLLDEMEERLVDGGVVVDYHSCELFPERWFDLVIVLTAETNVLHERLTSRNYSAKKLAANMECEIFRVLLEEGGGARPWDAEEEDDVVTSIMLAVGADAAASGVEDTGLRLQRVVHGILRRTKHGM